MVEIFEELLLRWRSTAAVLRSHSDSRGADLIEQSALELVDYCREVDNKALTIREAATRSGYTPDHLRREVRQGVIPNAGAKRSPRIRVKDLPRKPGLARSPKTTQVLLPSRSQVARSFLKKED
jgi:hypothetical protein